MTHDVVADVVLTKYKDGQLCSSTGAAYVENRERSCFVSRIHARNTSPPVHISGGQVRAAARVNKSSGGMRLLVGSRPISSTAAANVAL